MEIRNTGALLDPFDIRDIQLGSLAGAIDITKQPDKKITDISMIPVLDQKQQQSCVGYARAVILTYINYKETGKVELVSGDFGYALSKMFDGYPDMEGTYPRVLALKNIDIGSVLAKDFTRDLSLPHADYKKLDLTTTLKIKAAPLRIKSFGNVARSEAELVQAILDYDLVEITLPCDGQWSGTPFTNKSSRLGYHRVVLYGYERRENDTYFYIRNSWGETWAEKGNGVFAWSLFNNQIFDLYCFVDIPNAQLDEVKKIPLDLSYTFKKDLKKGMKDKDVLQLQFALKLEGCMDILVPTVENFGPKTEDAVKILQQKYKLPETGLCGPLTRAVLNQRYAPTTIVKNALDKWAFSIQSHEGFYPPGPRFPIGSMSWRNNNPGNIRCFGKYKQKAGRCSDRNFCIFISYEKGFDALKELLTDAATGKSTVYSPDMPLFSTTFNASLPRSSKNIPGFFQVYAPASDGNSPSTYALAVARAIGVPVETPIKNLI